MSYRLGIDVGGTHTDAVILDGRNRLLAKAKAATTPDVTGGIVQAMRMVLAECGVDRQQVMYAMLGTTHCTNAIVERKRLSRVGVIRLGAPATLAIEPMFSWPDDLRKIVAPESHILSGGHEFDGREIAPLNPAEIDRVTRSLLRPGRGRVEAVAVSSVFAPVNHAHEDSLAKTLRARLGPDIPVTVSHEIGSLGLLERENATILNAALIRTARQAFLGFAEAVKTEGLRADLFLGQNDGTLMNFDYALRYPILTIASGPSNSLRGGAFLSGIKNAIVVDVGGTTTDVGALSNGFPRESTMAANIGGVRTNFRMPDLVSLGLGGGTRVYGTPDDVRLGPESVGFRLPEEALVFGGKTLTATDIAVAAGRFQLGDPSRVRRLGRRLVAAADRAITEAVERAIDSMKLEAGAVPVVLVGGGSILLPARLAGASTVHRPDHFDVANAIGVAIAPVSAQLNQVFSYERVPREEAMKQVRAELWERATRAGADPESLELVEVEEIALAYLPGQSFQIRAKVAGNLRGAPAAENSSPDSR